MSLCAADVQSQLSNNMLIVCRGSCLLEYQFSSRVSGLILQFVKFLPYSFWVKVIL